MKKTREEDLGRKENYPHDEKKKKAQVETDQSFFSKKVQIYFKDNRLSCRSLLLFTIAMTAIKDQIKFFIS